MISKIYSTMVTTFYNKNILQDGTFKVMLAEVRGVHFLNKVGSRIYFEELRKFHFLLCFCSKIYVFAPQNYGAMQTLLREIGETKFQGPKNILKV